MMNEIKEKLKDPKIKGTLDRTLYNYDQKAFDNYVGDKEHHYLIGGAIKMLNYKNNLD